MKVGEQRGTYSALLRSYNEQRYNLSVKKKELQEKIDSTENGNIVYANEAATLELQYTAVSEKYDEYKSYMDELMQQWETELNRVSSKQQGEAMEEQAEEMGKILTIARRIMHGDIVPSSDEKKLMEYDDKLYQVSKNIGMMKQMEKRKKYKSLWEEEENKEKVDALEAADNQEAFAAGPEVVSVAETMESAAPSEATDSFSESLE